MAGWGEKFNKMTQTAISKSKEMAEITRLNMEINTYNQNIRDIITKIGEYVLENRLLEEDTTVMVFVEQIGTIKHNIETNQAKILELRNVSICSKCGAEIPKTSKFCDKCGNEMMKTEGEAETELASNVCTNCGQVLDAGSVFCGNCGTKQE